MKHVQATIDCIKRPPATAPRPASGYRPHPERHRTESGYATHLVWSQVAVFVTSLPVFSAADLLCVHVMPRPWHWCVIPLALSIALVSVWSAGSSIEPGLQTLWASHLSTPRQPTLQTLFKVQNVRQMLRPRAVLAPPWSRSMPSSSVGSVAHAACAGPQCNVPLLRIDGADSHQPRPRWQLHWAVVAAALLGALAVYKPLRRRASAQDWDVQPGTSAALPLWSPCRPGHVPSPRRATALFAASPAPQPGGAPRPAPTAGAPMNVYIAKVPLVGLEPFAERLPGLYPAPLWHLMVILGSSTGPAAPGASGAGPSAGADDVQCFDFLPSNPTDPRTTAALVSGNAVPGDVRQRPLPRVPRARCWLVGPAVVPDAVAEAELFQAQWDPQLRLITHDCRSHVEALTERLTGRTRVLQDMQL